MATSGPNLPGTGADDATVGTVVWTSPGNITLDDGSIASASGMASSTSHYIKGTNFSFSIPAGATINGILVEWKVAGGATGSTQNSIKMVKGGTISGNNKSTGANLPIATPAYVSFGGSADLWGLSWTVSDINASNFGTVFASTQAAADLGIQHKADAVRITITYTPGAAVANYNFLAFMCFLVMVGMTKLFNLSELFAIRREFMKPQQQTRSLALNV